MTVTRRLTRAKKLRVIGVTVLAVALASSCGARPDEGGGDSDSDGDQTIEFSLTGGTVPAQTQVVKDAIAAFEEENPDATVKLTEVGWDQAYSQYQPRLQAGDPPDIALLAPSWVSTFTESDAFAPADDYVSTDILDNFHESGEDGIVDDEGTRYGVQWDASIWGMYYRKDLFEQAGLDPESPPSTWEELTEAGTKLQAAGIKPLTFPFQGTDPDSYFLPMMWQAGAELVSEDGTPTVDSPEMLQAAEFLAGLVADGHVSKDITGQDWEGTMNTFIAGDAAIMFNGPWVVDALRDSAPDLDGQWATAAYPEGPAGPGTLGYPNALVISDLSDDKELAGEFIEFLFAERDDVPSYFFEFMKVTGVIGFTKDFAETDDEYVRDPLIQPFTESVPFARNRPIVPWYEEFRQRSFDPKLQQLVLGELTPPELVEQLAADAEQLAAQ